MDILNEQARHHHKVIERARRIARIRLRRIFEEENEDWMAEMEKALEVANRLTPSEEAARKGFWEYLLSNSAAFGVGQAFARYTPEAEQAIKDTMSIQYQCGQCGETFPSYNAEAIEHLKEHDAVNSYNMMPHGFLYVSDGLPNEDMSNVYFLGEASEVLPELFADELCDQMAKGEERNRDIDLWTTERAATVFAEEASKIQAMIEANGEPFPLCASFDSESTVAWTCTNHPPGLEVSVPKGEACCVCGNVEN